MRVRAISRSSALAIRQARRVGSAVAAAIPNAKVDYILKSSKGDRDAAISLWQSTDKGLFTTDISEALVNGDAEIAVHSWKDLPVSPFPGTMVAGTLEPFFLENATRWADALRDAGADIELAERVGDHGDPFWQAEFPRMVGWAFGGRPAP